MYRSRSRRHFGKRFRDHGWHTVPIGLVAAIAGVKRPCDYRKSETGKRHRRRRARRFFRPPARRAHTRPNGPRSVWLETPVNQDTPLVDDRPVITCSSRHEVLRHGWDNGNKLKNEKLNGTTLSFVSEDKTRIRVVASLPSPRRTRKSRPNERMDEWKFSGKLLNRRENEWSRLRVLIVIR